MKTELMWLLIVVIGVVGALLSSRVIRTMIKETVFRPKESCRIAVSKDKVTVTTPQAEEVKHVRN